MNTLALPVVWHSRADISNTAGYRFIGLMSDGTEEICTVCRREDGSHTLQNDAWPRLKSWRVIPTGEITPRPFLQAAFRDASGVLRQSFALVRQRADGRAEAIAVADCADGKIVRQLAIFEPATGSIRNVMTAHFLAAVEKTLADGPAAPFRQYGPRIDAVMAQA